MEGPSSSVSLFLFAFFVFVSTSSFFFFFFFFFFLSFSVMSLRFTDEGTRPAPAFAKADIASNEMLLR